MAGAVPMPLPRLDSSAVAFSSGLILFVAVPCLVFEPEPVSRDDLMAVNALLHRHVGEQTAANTLLCETRGCVRAPASV